MPVLATLATINLLFRSGAEDVSFLDPKALRARCMDVIEDVDTRARVLQLTGELQLLARRYDDAVTATLDAYIAESRKWESSVNGLIKQLEPMDSVRVRTLQEIVRVRQSMLEMLTVEQWNLVFR